MRRASLGNATSAVDLRIHFPPVGDQGRRSTCVAFAVTDAHDELRTQADALSEEGLYWGCKCVDGSSAAGTSFVSAADALTRWGQPREEVWPYNSGLTDSDPLPGPPGGPPDLRAWYKSALQPAQCTVDAIKSHLDAGTPVILGIRTGNQFQASRDGHIPMPRSARRLTYLHAILAVGYTTDDLIFRNSWGTRWGDQGYGYLPFPYLDQYAPQAWTVITP